MAARSIVHTAIAFATMAGLALSAPTTPATHAGGGGITLGLVTDLTGSASVYGVSIHNGAQLAVDMINKSNGIPGHSLILQTGDAASSPTQVISLYQQYIHGSTLALIGPTLSNEAFKADPIAQSAGIPVVATSNTATGITAMGNYIFRMSLGEADVIPLTIKTALAKLHFKKVAIIYGNDNAFTISDGKIFAAVAAKLGLTVADTETFATGDKDFSTQLTKIKGAQPDAILVGALAPEAVPILIQGRQLGIPTSVHFIGGNGFNSPAVISGAGKAAEGAIEGTAWFANSASSLNRQFVAAYKARYGKAPDQFAAQAFDGVNILAAAIKAAGIKDLPSTVTADRTAIRNALASLKGAPVVTGATGTFSFTATRDAGELGTVQIIQNGQFVQYT